jgi:hypothetical protein
VAVVAVVISQIKMEKMGVLAEAAAIRFLQMLLVLAEQETHRL